MRIDVMRVVVLSVLLPLIAVLIWLMWLTMMVWDGNR